MESRWVRSIEREHGGHQLCLRRSQKWHLGVNIRVEMVVTYSCDREVSNISIPIATLTEKPAQPFRYGRRALEIRNVVVMMNFNDCF